MVRLRQALFAAVLLAAATAQAHLIVDMKLTVRAPAFVAAGQPFTYDVVADDLANDNALGIVVTNTVPAGVTIAGTTAPGWNCTTSKSVVTCSAEQLGPGEHVISIRVTAPAQAGAIVDRAHVASLGSTDLESKNDDATRSVTIYDPSRCTAPAPVLLSPTEGAVIDDANASFNWTPSAAGANYVVRVTTEGAATAAVSSTSSTSTAALVDRGESRWFVEATFTDCPPVASETRRLVKTRAAAVRVTDAATGFRKPAGIAFGPNGEMYVTDEDAAIVSSVASGQATTIAGAAGELGSTNGQFARFNHPTGITVTPLDGFIYVADTQNNDVRILYTGGPFVPAFSVANAALHTPAAVAATFRGSIYVADTGGGAVRLLTPVPGTTGIFTLSNVAQLSAPAGLAVGDVVYVSDDHAVKKIATNGAVSTLASGFDTPAALALDALGNVYVCDRGTRALLKIAPSGLVTPIAQFGDPTGVAIAADGSVYVADAAARAVRRVETVLADAPPPPPAPRRRAASH